MTMPDTKSGREKKGLNKEAQLESELAQRELGAVDQDEPPRFEDVDDELLADPSELDELDD